MTHFDDWPEELQGIFENVESAHFFDDDEYQEFADAAEELFYEGFVNVSGDSEQMQNARAEFFALLEEYDIAIGIDEFDWDAWRDWYEGA